MEHNYQAILPPLTMTVDYIPLLFFTFQTKSLHLCHWVFLVANDFLTRNVQIEKKNTFKLFVERLITTLRSIDIGIWILWYLRHLCMVGVIRGICMSYYTVLRVVLRICFRVRLYLGEPVGWVTIQQANKNTQPHYTQKRLDKNNDKKRKTETKTEV